MIRFKTLAAALFAAGLSGAPAVHAQNDKAAPPQAQPWVVDCTSRNSPDGRLVCQMSQTILAQETGQRVMAAVIARPKRDAAPVMTLTLPHGLNLTAGVGVWVDDNKREQLPIETADQNGSYAHLELSSERLSAMRRGKALNVAVTSAGGGEVVVQFSLAGFSSTAENL